MTSKSLSLTPRARLMLTQMTKKGSLQKPVFTIARGTVTGTGKSRWGVAVYELDNLSAGTEILQIDGLDFYIDPSVEVDVLGKALDFDEGTFKLVE